VVSKHCSEINNKRRKNEAKSDSKVGKTCGKEGSRRGNLVAKRDHGPQSFDVAPRDLYEATLWQ
jgi:hypothetical protein